VHEMALGLREGDGGTHLITFHPTGGQSSAKPLHDEEWLDFNMIQSGHSRLRYNYEMIARDYIRTPPKPILDGEPCYEHHPESFNASNGYIDEVDVRQCAYWSLLNGACGHTYGDHSIWGFWTPGVQYGFGRSHFCVDWVQALDASGASQMAYLKRLILSLNWLSSRPAPELIVEQLPGQLHIPVLKGDGFLLAYTAQGLPIELVPNALSGDRASVHWFNPRTGNEHMADDTETQHQLTFRPPTGGRGQDWVLILKAR